MQHKTLQRSTALFFSFVVLASATAAKAELPKPGTWKIANSLKASTYLDSSYEYNFDIPPPSTDVVGTPQNKFRAYDRGSNQFLINQATIGLSSTDDNVLFDARFGFGPQISFLNTNPEGTTEDAFKNIRRAFVGYQSHGFAFRFGKMDANFGLERIDAVDNWNYSRSLVFATSQPIYHTGLAVSYEHESGFGGELTVANGDNRNYDNNKKKAVMAKFTYEKKDYAASLGYMTTQETAGRQYFNVNVKWLPVTNLWVGLDGNFIHGRDEILQINGISSVRQAAKRFGAALYAQYQYMTGHTLSLRGEWLRDSDGAITLTNARNNLYSYTLTNRCMITSNLSMWIEGRIDQATTQLFSDQGNNPTRKIQPTALLGLTFNI